MPLEVGDIILRDFELSISFFTRTNKITPPPLNVQPCSTPIKIKTVVIMEGPNWCMINLWNNKKLKRANNPMQGALVMIDINTSKVDLDLNHK